MKKFWKWMVKNKYCIFGDDWLVAFSNMDYYMNLAKVPKQMLIGYMLEYLFQKEPYVVLENLTIDGGEEKSKKIMNIYNDLKQKIEEV